MKAGQCVVKHMPVHSAVFELAQPVSPAGLGPGVFGPFTSCGFGRSKLPSGGERLTIRWSRIFWMLLQAAVA